MAPHPSTRQEQRGSRPHPTASSSSSRSLKKRGGPKLTLRRTLDGPMHDEAHIRHTFRTSLIKPRHEATPKSSLGNLASVACDKMPTYKSVQGHVSDGTTGEAIETWRSVGIIPTSDIGVILSVM
ncbi:hypothetical protein C0992_005422 [Termitomyces sp. T32_za158]|nr:hypothetical protein C0992_005422 [Termitomyces sp. T32_za158]